MDEKLIFKNILHEYMATEYHRFSELKKKSFKMDIKYSSRSITKCMRNAEVNNFFGLFSQNKNEIL